MALFLLSVPGIETRTDHKLFIITFHLVLYKFVSLFCLSILRTVHGDGQDMVNKT